ncbi:HAD hydrolase-like protein [Mycobacterium tilburgii]|uniref:HAD hydrolase-like protein n=1 Tax=Mycobacterium tilburgii TaxID=44467 RepID=UPI0021B3770D|nr:HAD hydrolase-like protein [Mycobacterium tilburgii]
MAVLRGKRILFDIDGTLIDSTATVEQAWDTWPQEYGVDYEEVRKVCHGRRTEVTVAQFVSPQHRVAATARQLALQEQADLAGVTALPGRGHVAYWTPCRLVTGPR